MRVLKYGYKGPCYHLEEPKHAVLMKTYWAMT